MKIESSVDMMHASTTNKAGRITVNGVSYELQSDSVEKRWCREVNGVYSP